MISKAKLFWQIQNLRNLLLAICRLLIYAIANPKKIPKLAWTIVSDVNELHTVTSHVPSFESTQTFQKLKAAKISASCNLFNADPRVIRPLEVLTLATMVKYFQPAAIFEIGTYSGFTTSHFAHNTPASTKVYTLDLPEDFRLTSEKRYSYDDELVVRLSRETVKKRIYRGDPAEKKISELFGDSLKFDFSKYSGKIDLVYIDGCHAYDYVKSDTENALKMLSEKGVIIWHDFDYLIHRDVFRYLTELSKILPIYTIPKTRLAIYSR